MTDPNDIFDKELNELMDRLGEECSKNGVKTIIAIAAKDDANPVVFCKGELLDVARLAAKFLRQIKSKIFTELSTD